MILQRTERFRKQVKLLTGKDKTLAAAIGKTLRQLSEYPPPVPALRMKAVKGARGIFECSVNMYVRITFEFAGENTILLRNIDYHDAALRKP